MIFLAAFDPNLLTFVLLGIIIIGLGALLRYLHQPYVVAYILAGIFLGEHGFGIITDQELIHKMGEFGLILLLFFIGMEISLPDLLKNWQLTVLGTLGQIFFTLVLVSGIGWAVGWELNFSIVVGFVICLSSSAVVIKLLEERGEAHLEIGQHVISILLMQDILIVPMLIATNYLAGQVPPLEEILRQLIGGALLIWLIFYILRKKQITLPFSNKLQEDHELQVFLAFSICFGFALVTALFGLSAALGAFVAGIVVHAARSTEWFHDSLHSFRVLFVALFFVSVGMLIDLPFLRENWQIVGLLILVVYISNHFINAAILHYFGNSWKESMYGGALLAQIGELSFVLAATAFHAEIVSDYGYQLAIIVISLTLLLSPFWVLGIEWLIQPKQSE